MSPTVPPRVDDEQERAAAALVERIRSGDRRAEEELVARFAPGLLYLLRHLTRDPAWAEDLHQETLATALAKLRSGALQEPEKLAAFLRGTAKNLARASRRKESRRSRWVAAAEAAGDEAAPAADPPDPAPSPLEALLLDEEIDLSERLLAELPSPRDREVLFRFCVAEEDRDHICRALDLTRSQLNLVLFRARRRFRRLYQEALAGSRGSAGGGDGR